MAARKKQPKSNALDVALNELDRVTVEWREAAKRAKDFEMMLARICYRFKRRLSVDDAIVEATDLLKRKGTASPLRESATV